jgi:poly-gamma-glutamate synthesis protein (capsule biosynthesis protein)
MPAYADGPRGSLALIACSATFTRGDEACEASGHLPGRPGLSPLRHRMTLKVTPRQLDVLDEIDRATGLQAMRAETITLLGLDPARAIPGCLSLLGGLFQVSGEAGVETRCDPGDLSDITARVRDARQRADAVIVSVHAHEPSLSPEEPGKFLRAFAHQAVESGADAVIGHGPHFLRGVEVYKGKPIFYSLGNIVSQIELGELIPAEDYAKVPTADRASPARYFAARAKNGTALFGSHRKYWESVVPVLTFDDGNLVSAVTHPVDLGFGDAVYRRGRPRIAGRQLGADILDQVARMSKPYGTQLEIQEQGDTHVQVIHL